jgi:hypothetical protein
MHWHFIFSILKISSCLEKSFSSKDLDSLEAKVKKYVTIGKPRQKQMWEMMNVAVFSEKKI